MASTIARRTADQLCSRAWGDGDDDAQEMTTTAADRRRPDDGGPAGASSPRSPIARRPGLYALPPVAEPAEWLDVEATARYLDVHPNTIYRMIRDGRLPALRSPVRLRREDLDACLDRCRIRPGELAHLNAYATGDHLAAERAVTKAGTPDRRYGPRLARGTASSAGDRAPDAKATRPSC